MEIELNKNDLKEIDYIIDHFIEPFTKNDISITALAFCLQKLIEGKEELVKALKREEDD